MEHGLISVLAEDTRDVILIGMVVRNGSPRTDAGQQRRDKEKIDQCVFHDTTKVWRDRDVSDSLD